MWIFPKLNVCPNPLKWPISAFTIYNLLNIFLQFLSSLFSPFPSQRPGSPAGRARSARRRRWCFNCHFLLRRPWHSHRDRGEAVGVIRGNGEKKREREGEMALIQLLRVLFGSEQCASFSPFPLSHPTGAWSDLTSATLSSWVCPIWNSN